MFPQSLSLCELKFQVEAPFTVTPNVAAAILAKMAALAWVRMSEAIQRRHLYMGLTNHDRDFRSFFEEALKPFLD